MGNETNSIVARNTSFWQLINNCTIKIPNYQREYAQGRNNRRAELIRNGFVYALYNSLKENETLELDFIFGGKESDDTDNSFNPVDGQQRLTILFLLHWYVFVRSKKGDYLKTLKEKFLYKTRTTSEMFCGKICEELLEFNFDLDNKGEIRISAQIKDQPWFTGAMSRDPTVKSMLVVIDCIHKHFLDTIDYEKTADVLVSADCPICFYCLDLNNVLGISSGIRDLYIKMNARGVPLTDFELFKADLQKKDNQHFDLMAKYLGDKDTLSERVNLIGKFNNEYTNFFFELIDDGRVVNLMDNAKTSQMFDVAMMNFINEIFRMNYFCKISELGVSQKAYRADNDVFRKMSGKEFITFINTNGKIYNEKYWGNGVSSEKENEIQKNIVDSFGFLIRLLDIVVSIEDIFFDTMNTKCVYSFNDMLKKLAVDPQDNRALPFRESLIRIGLFEFILKFGIPDDNDKKDAFSVWSRFIWKIDKNSEFKNFDEVVETLRGYKEIINSCTACTSIAIVSAILKAKSYGAPARLQFNEERLKAELIVNDNKWADVFTKAEDYFNDCGQIWFLLELAKETRNENSLSHNYDKFIRAFNVSKEIFDGTRNIVSFDSCYFERALLAVEKYDKEDHLLSMGKYTINTKRFVGKDFSNHISHQFCDSSESSMTNKYLIVMELLQKIIDDSVLNPMSLNIENWLKNYIDNGSSTVEWKNVFIKNNLLNKNIPGLLFKNGFEPEAWNENGYNYTAVYTNEMKRTYSGELYSFLLAAKLFEKNKKIQYYTSSQEEYIVDGFPNRFFTIDNTDIGFKEGIYYSRTNGIISEIGTIEDAISKYS